MAKTVDNHSTIEDFRRRYNELATDVGDISGLRDTIKNFNGGSIVDAVNAIEDKTFFFQEFIYTATSGQTTFSGDDEFDNELKFKRNRIQVFKNDQHLLETDDYLIASPLGAFHTSIVLNVAASLNDKITIYSYTGSFEGTANAANIVGYFSESTANTIYNTNDNGVILNGDNSTPTTILQAGYTLQLAGKTYAEEDITLASGKTLTAPIITDGTAQITGGVGTSFSSITSTNFVGNLTGDVTSSGLSTFSNADINGGAIDGTTIGATTTSTGAFTTVSASGGFSGNLTGNVTGNVTGNLTGNVTGDLTGDVTGDVTGNLSGNVTGNVTGNLTGNVTGTVSSISNHSTTNLTEGTNKYYTDARVDARIANASIGDLNDVSSSSALTGQILAWSGSQWAPVDNQDSDAVTEGVTNLFYTDERVSTRVDTILNHSNHSNITATKVGDEIRLSAASQYGDSDVQSYLSGGEGLALSGSGSFSVNTSNGVKISGDNVVLDYETTSTAPSSVGSTSTGHLWFVI